MRMGKDTPSGGDLSEVLKNGMDPGHVLAREVIQNSWDAANRLRSQLIPGFAEPFEVVFRFHELAGDAKLAFVSKFALHELRARMKAVGPKNLKIGNHEVLELLDDPTVTLRLLEASDFGAHGLFGPVQRLAKSVLWQAIYYMGGSKKSDGGGSYGFGKSAFIRGSNIKTLFAYSCFRKYPGTVAVDDPASRRFVGMTWWQNHELDGVDYQGRAEFAQLRQTGHNEKDWLPYEDADADDFAHSAGLQLRRSVQDNELGTSLLLVSPTVEPAGLLDAVERFWWPAIVDREFSVRVVDSDGVEQIARPRLRSDLVPFIDAYDAMDEKPADIDVRFSNWQRFTPVGESKKIELGTLAVVVPPGPGEQEEAQASGQSGSSDDGIDEDALRSDVPLVALIRAPKMVVRYLPAGSGPVPLRGVFYSSSDADPYLRETETYLHDDWSIREDLTVPDSARSVAKTVKSRVSRFVTEVVSEFAPAPPKKQVRSNIYAQLLSPFLDGKKYGPPPPPPPNPMPISFQYVDGPEVEPHGLDALKAKATFRLELKIDNEKGWKACQVVVQARVRALEDEGSNASAIGAVLMPPFPSDVAHGDPSSDMWFGTLEAGVPLEFGIVSQPYNDMWTIDIAPRVEVLESSGDK